MVRTYITTTEYDAPREYFDLDKASSWEGRREWDGANRADVNVGANAGQNLYRTAGGRWVLGSWSSYVSTPDSYEWVTDEKAHEWLLYNDHDDAAQEHFGPAAEERAAGRPMIGARICVRLGDHLTAVDAYAKDRGISRADAVRQLVEQALTANA